MKRKFKLIEFKKIENMKNIIIIFLISFLFMISCKKEDPVIAEPSEMSVKTTSGSFICQPVADNDGIVAIVKSGTEHSLVRFDSHAQPVWQHAIDSFMFPSYTFENIDYVGLLKDKDNSYLVNFFAIPPSPTNIPLQYIKAVKFSNSGEYLWQLADSIHQPKNIQIGGDIINLGPTGNFLVSGFVSLSNSTYAVISTSKSNIRDSTFIQISFYDSDGLSTGDGYSVIPGRWDFNNVYSTSKDQLFIPASLAGGGSFYFLIDLQGNVIFALFAEGLLLDTYFMNENSTGEFMVSSSYLDADAILRGAILTINQNGEYSKPAKVFSMSPSWVMLSMQEVADGYIFSGFNTSNLLITGIDWRTSFLQEEHHAVILKTNFELQDTWSRLIFGTYFTSGALTIGNEPISFFGGKYERENLSIFMLKYNQQGEIFQ